MFFFSFFLILDFIITLCFRLPYIGEEKKKRLGLYIFVL